MTVFLFAFEQAQYARLYPTEFERNLGHLKSLGIHHAPLRFAFGALGQADARLIEEIIDANSPFVAVCPGGRQAGHRWPVERFIEVAKNLKNEYQLRLVAVGNQDERELCEQLLKGAGGGVNLAGELTLLGTAELLSRASLLLTNDTGPMHLAGARGTKVVAIYGSKDLPGRWYPAGEGHELFRARAACRQCLFAEQESDHCIRQIHARDVWAGCQRILERSDKAKEDATPDATFLKGEALAPLAYQT